MDEIVQTDTQPETLEFPWTKREDESPLWYDRFVKYFLQQGPTRSLLKAYTAWVTEENPDRAIAALLSPPRTATASWSDAAFRWDWRERARAFDAHAYQTALKRVDEARTHIVDIADKAVKALEESLDNPKLKVAAAKEILDRAGLPSVQVTKSAVLHFSADDLAKARKEVEQWEKQVSNPESG